MQHSRFDWQETLTTTNINLIVYIVLKVQYIASLGLMDNPKVYGLTVNMPWYIISHSGMWSAKKYPKSLIAKGKNVANLHYLLIAYWPYL